MIPNKFLPLFWKHLERWFPGEKRMLLNVKGNKMAMRPRSYDLYVLGEVFWEEVYAPRLKQITAPEVVLDLGANIGAFSVWAARRWHVGKIVAVEMEDDNFDLLEENIRLNGLRGAVIPVKAAIWDENVQVGIKRHPFNHGMHQVCLDTGEKGIPALTLVKLMDTVKVKKVDILKMDIEGAEDRIFNGTNERLFAQGVGYLVAEMHPTKGVLVERIVEILEKTGFEVNIRQQWLRTTVLLEAVNKRF
jgi:FkbM family methyltransferase